MKTHPLCLAAAILVISSALASAQMQNDSLGAPTPRPNQNAAPATMPNIPVPNPTGQDTSTPPKADAKSPSTSGENRDVSAGRAGTEKTNGVTPGGLTPD